MHLLILMAASEATTDRETSPNEKLLLGGIVLAYTGKVLPTLGP